MYCFLSGFFTHVNHFEIHPCCCMCQEFVPSHCCVVFHCTNAPQCEFIFLRWTSELLPVSGSMKSCHKHSGAYLLVDISTSFTWILPTMGRCMCSFGYTAKQFSKVAAHMYASTSRKFNHDLPTIYFYTSVDRINIILE